ncbi:uncharacterized protein BJ171DRAFT_73084 [Polychytrium aggregatum]|uniref:uncharacterized protein n=1 Tax=Polychytrium aggregatum TaxID=110093 RepID=UPI0022FDFF97|nr:uncharacterized protein BJ171DRAFT_73084 [Polychytrium aggregatum]KAI9205397.1 hypothetical protein BJ171DRAFT_73084 [Polychytrium aggregatum]
MSCRLTLSERRVPVELIGLSVISCFRTVHMNDPVSTLHRYKLKAGSKIMMIGDDQPISDRAPAPSSSTQASTSTTSYSSTPTPAPAIKQPLTEEDLIAKISTSVNYTNETLLPMIEHYTMVAEQFIRISTASGYTVKHLETEYAKVSETLLQTLIKIDSVDCGEFVQARQHRRDAVKLVQGLMDRVDQVKERVKASTSRNVPPVQL